MSTPVKYTDLVESDALIKVANDARVAIELLQDIQSLQRDVAKGNVGGNPTQGNPTQGNPTPGKPTPSPTTGGKKDYEDLTKARQADIESINKQNKAYKEYITVSDELKKAKKTEADAVKALASPYSALNQELVKNRQLSKDLLAQQAVGTKLTEEQNAALTEAHAKTQILDKQIKTIDATLGNHHRNVGNYTGAIRKTAMGVSGLTGLLGIFGKALGLDEEAVMGLEQAHSVLRAGSRDLSHLTHLGTESTEESTIATEAQTVSEGESVISKEAETGAIVQTTIATKALNLMRMISIPVIGWIIGAGAALVAGYYFLIKATDDAAESQAKLAADIDRTNKILKIQSDSAIKIAENQKEIDDASGLSKEKLLADEMKILNKKESARQIELQQSEANLTQLQKQVNYANDVGKLEEQTAAREALNKEIENNGKLKAAGNDYHHNVLVAQIKFNTDKAKEDDDAKKDRIQKELDFLIKLRDLRTGNIADDFTRESQIIKDKYSDDIKEFAGHSAILKELKIKEEADLLVLEKKYDDAEFQKRWDDAVKEIELEKKIAKQIKEANQQTNIIQKNTALDDAGEVTKKAKKANNFEDEKAGLIEEMQIKQDIIKTQAKDEIENLTGTEKEKAAITEKIIAKRDEDLLKLKYSYTDTVDSINDEIHKKEMKRAKEESDAIISLTEDSLKRKDDLTLKQLNNDLEMRQRNIIQQQQLASEGKSNTLAFEKAAEAKDELRKEQLAIKQQKDAKAIALFKLLASAADKDDPMKALTEAFTAMAIASAVSGSYIEGTENVGKDLKGNKIHNGKDGYRINVDGDERILNPEQNAMIGDMSNETLAKLAMNFNNGLLPKHIIEAGPGSFAENIVNSMMLHQLTETNNRLASLEKALKERPVSSTTIDQNGIVSKSELRNGLIRVTRKPNAPLNNF